MKQKLVFIGLAWCIFFLALGSSAISYGQSLVPKPDSINWVGGGGLYVISTDNVNSMRQTFKDLQQYVLPKSAYSLKLKRILDNACRRLIFPGSSFIGHVIDPEGSTKALCIMAVHPPKRQTRLICSALNLRFAFSNPAEREFGCEVPGPPKKLA